jgi:AAA domain
VTATVAPGGGAKTALKLAEAVSMAIGRDLLDGNKPIEQLRVWYWNGEDPLDEINRRLAAICVYYKLDVKELEGWLFIDSGHDMPICLATEDRGRVMIDGPSVSQINKTIEKNNIDANDPRSIYLRPPG